MRAVESRTRLEQLQSLLRRTQHQIRIAHSRGDGRELARLQDLEERLNAAIVAEGGTVSRALLKGGKPRGRARKRAENVLKHLEQLGVTSHDVKVWAVSVGLIPAVVRGRERVMYPPSPYLEPPPACPVTWRCRLGLHSYTFVAVRILGAGWFVTGQMGNPIGAS